jgi:hypothetical protein
LNLSIFGCAEARKPRTFGKRRVTASVQRA